MRRIAIFGRLDDPHVSRVVSAALKRGHYVVQIAPEGWAGDGREPHSIVVRPDGSVSCELGLEDAFEVDAAWVRELPAILPEIDVRAGLPAIERGVIAEMLRHRFERARVVEAIANTLVALGKTVIDPPAASRVLSLVLIAKAGVPVVESVLTDDPEPAPGEKNKSGFLKSPLLFQAPGPGEKLRILTIGERIFSPGPLPREVSEAVSRARQAAGLIFAGVDIYFDGRNFAVAEITGAPDFSSQDVIEALLDALETQLI
jgi:hypothetical protein